MFGKKNNENANKTTSSSPISKLGSNTQSACVIVQGTVIEGDFYSKNDTRLDGTIKGTVKCDARLIMGNQSEIEGKVNSKNATIMGSLSGDLEIEGLLSLGDTARVSGNVKASKMEVAEGAFLNGDIAVG